MATIFRDASAEVETEPILQSSVPKEFSLLKGNSFEESIRVRNWGTRPAEEFQASIHTDGPIRASATELEISGGDELDVVLSET